MKIIKYIGHNNDNQRTTGYVILFCNLHIDKEYLILIQFPLHLLKDV